MRTTKLFLVFAACAILFAGCKKDTGNGGGGEDEPTTYTITVISSGNGTAEADKTTATEGETVTLYAIPDRGYGLVKWTVENGGAELSNPAVATVTFTMPASNVSFKAEFIVRGILINGAMWALYNVDAPGTFTANPEDYGMFYQWNRRTGWSTTDPIINTDGGSIWDNTSIEGNTWLAANDPCPEGWRVPTRTDFLNMTATIHGEWTSINKVFGFKIFSGDSFIFFPYTGYRNPDNGNLDRPKQANYWTSTSENSKIPYFLINSLNRDITAIYSADRNHGFSVRCVAK